MIMAIEKHLRQVVCMLGGMALVFLVSTSVQAANVFEEQGGRFAVNLPDGWSLTPQQEDTVYVFKGSGVENIIIQYVPNETSVSKLFKMSVDTFRQAGIPNAEPDGAIKDMNVNNHPGRWGFYKGEYSGNKVKLNAALGAVALKDAGVSFVSVLSDASRGKMAKIIEQSFQSIRESGQTVTGVSGAKSVAADTTASQPTEFKHELLSLTLPPGWTSQKLPQNFEKEVIGWFLSDRIIGGSVLAICYRGFGINQENVAKASKATVEGSIPNASLVNAYDMEHKGGKVPVVVYRGSKVSAGQDIPMSAVTTIVKTDKCRLAVVGFSQAQGASALEKQVLDITQSAR